MAERNSNDFLGRAESQVVDFEKGITEKTEEARKLLLKLISQAREQGVFPTEEFVYPPDRIGSKRANTSKEEALLIDIQAEHQGISSYVMLMGDGLMMRCLQRKRVPKGLYDPRQRVHYDGEKRKALSDYEYVVLTPKAALTILRLLK